MVIMTTVDRIVAPTYSTRRMPSSQQSLRNQMPPAPSRHEQQQRQRQQRQQRWRWRLSLDSYGQQQDAAAGLAGAVEAGRTASAAPQRAVATMPTTSRFEAPKSRQVAP